ncbi:MAG: flagellar basal-body MS-ring/collar protein FliF [Desulfobacterota bacterium]|nr:flagellar basal-body MS-ring/collar protein FliF [Thermodesulfobacteriota bacterium]
MNILSNLLNQTIALYSAFPPKKRILLLIAVLLTIVCLIGLIVWANRIDYKTLYTGLSAEDAGAVITRLRDKKVPYRVANDGSSILVPSSKVYELRMELASEGLPQSSTVGYEIFDKQNIGVTEFIQKVNFQRALQGELARTISKFAEVKSARVHLTIPEKSLFREDQEKPRASVVLTLHAGRRLLDAQIQGIAHLVSSSVEGLTPENVFIVDAHGKLLAGGKDRSRQVELTSTQQQLQSATEKALEDKIINLLGNVVGHDKINAKVSVVMDFTQIEQTVENYDPNSTVVRSEQRSSEKSSGKRSGAVGIPGVVSNTPETKQQTEEGGLKTSEYNKSDETINYEISRITKHIINQPGSINRITAAVLIDGTYVNEKTDKGQLNRKYVPRTDEEMKKYEALVKRAVGYDEQRGDSVEVVNVQFSELVSEAPSAVERIIGEINWQSVITYIITAFLFAIFIIFGLKPLLKMVSRTIELVKPAAELGEGRAELREPGAPAIGGEQLIDLAVQKLGQKQASLLEFAQKNPRLFAQYLKNWLK